MKQWLATAYIVLTISGMLAVVSWLTWSNTCHDILDLTSADETFAGVCRGDTSQFAGILAGCIVVALAYLIITVTIFKLLDVKLTRTKPTPTTKDGDKTS